MKYETRDGKHVEWIWNSRDGVTPFGMDAHPDYCEVTRARMSAEMGVIEPLRFEVLFRNAVLLYHADYHLDRSLPYYKPSTGERVFVDYTIEHAKASFQRIVDRDWQTDEDAAAIEARIAELEALHEAFFQKVEDDTAEWIKGMTEKPPRKIERPEYDAAGEELIERHGRLVSRVRFRNEFSSKEEAVLKMAQESMQQPGQPTVILGGVYNASEPMATAEREAIDLIARFQKEPESQAALMDEYQLVRGRFADAVSARHLIILAPKRSGGLPVVRKG